nr:ATP-dependent metallopeptidase FtsH/Yme1/Tma family protein [Chitinophagales bacterium]
MKSNNQNQNNPQNNDENNPVPESRGPRINIIAIIGVLFGVFIAQQLFFPLESSNTKEISEQEFLRKILPSHDVAKIQIVNKERVEVFIKADSLANPEYQDVRPANATRFNEKNPQYYFTIASAENFDADLRDAQRSFDPTQIINAKNVSRTNWMVEILQYLLPIFIVVAIWIFLMRRMSG